MNRKLAKKILQREQKLGGMVIGITVSFVLVYCPIIVLLIIDPNAGITKPTMYIIAQFFSKFCYSNRSNQNVMFINLPTLQYIYLFTSFLLASGNASSNSRGRRRSGMSFLLNLLEKCYVYLSSNGQNSILPV